MTAAKAFPNVKQRLGGEVTNRSVPRQDHVTKMERYFTNGLESSAPTVNKGNGMPTM